MTDTPGDRRLTGRRVVVTRAAEHAADLAELICRQGGEAVVVPLVRIEPLAAGVDALAAADLGRFGWIVVTSPNGARALTGRVVPAHVRIAAVGGRTSDALLHAVGRAADLVPTAQRGDALVAAIAEASAVHGPGASAAVAVVHAAGASPVVVDGLRAGRWDVTVFVTYHSVAVAPSAGERAAVAGAEVLLLASGSAARAWVEAFGPVSPPVVVAIGPQTAAVAVAAGLGVTAVAADHSLAGLVDAIPVSAGAEAEEADEAEEAEEADEADEADGSDQVPQAPSS